MDWNRLKVKNKYDKGNNTWLGNENKSGEYAVAYFGIIDNKNLSQTIENLNFENKSLFCDVKDTKNKNFLSLFFFAKY